MNGMTGIIIATIGAVSAVTGAFFTAQATADSRVNAVDTKVEVLTERQELQYKEVKEALSRIEGKLDQSLK